MKTKTFKIKSKSDGLLLDTSMFIPANPKAIVIFSHGMAEHKERYFDFMQYLTEHQYLTIIHDHRGHGFSIENENDLGYFYDETADYIVEDLHDVYLNIKNVYSNLPVYLFSHSMGTLVARKYLKKYDDTLDKLVLCGAPCDNRLKKLALVLAKTIKTIKGNHYRSPLINRLVFANADELFEGELKNRWLSKNQDNVQKYNDDPLCGFTFTTNGFINLFQLLIDTFDENHWILHKTELPILMIAGQDDPIIGSSEKWYQTKTFLNNLGYQNIENILYPNLRHEILNESNNQKVYQDILNFFDK